MKLLPETVLKTLLILALSTLIFLLKFGAMKSHENLMPHDKKNAENERRAFITPLIQERDNFYVSADDRVYSDRAEYMELSEDNVKQFINVFVKFAPESKVNDYITLFLKNNPDKEGVVTALGAMLYTEGHPNLAMEVLDQVLQKNSANVMALQALKVILEDTGQVDKFIQIYYDTLKQYPDNVELYKYLELYYLESSRFAEAEDLIRLGIKQNHGNPVFFFLLGDLMAKTGKLDDALEAYKQGLIIKPDEAYGYFCLGFTLLELGQNNPADQMFIFSMQLSQEYEEKVQEIREIIKTQDFQQPAEPSLK